MMGREELDHDGEWAVEDSWGYQLDMTSGHASP